MTGMWLADGSCRRIPVEFKEISRVWGFEIAGEKQTSLKENLAYDFITSAGATQERNVSSLSFVNKLRVFTVWAL